MKRFVWTIGMGAAGLLLGLKGQDTQTGVGWTVLIVLWFASIGYGLGSIFDQKHPSKRLVVYWAITLALVAPFLALPVGAAIQPDLANLPFRQQAPVGAIGVLVGALFGVFVGTIHLRRLRRQSGTGLPERI
jgi:branched-subunit amino acid permease